MPKFTICASKRDGALAMVPEGTDVPEDHKPLHAFLAVTRDHATLRFKDISTGWMLHAFLAVTRDHATLRFKDISTGWMLCSENLDLLNKLEAGES